jgi:hypothetical protein
MVLAAGEERSRPSALILDICYGVGPELPHRSSFVVAAIHDDRLGCLERHQFARPKARVFRTSIKPPLPVVQPRF